MAAPPKCKFIKITFSLFLTLKNEEQYVILLFFELRKYFRRQFDLNTTQDAATLLPVVLLLTFILIYRKPLKLVTQLPIFTLYLLLYLSNHLKNSLWPRRLLDSFALLKPTRNFFLHLTSTTMFANIITPVNTALNSGRFCIMRARELLVELNQNLWTSCGAGVVVTDPLIQINPSVNAIRAIIRGLRLALYSQFYSSSFNRPSISLYKEFSSFLLKLATISLLWWKLHIYSLPSFVFLPLLLPLSPPLPPTSLFFFPSYL